MSHQGKQVQAAARADKRAALLRENLKRRKQQKQERTVSAGHKTEKEETR